MQNSTSLESVLFRKFTLRSLWNGPLFAPKLVRVTGTALGRIAVVLYWATFAAFVGCGVVWLVAAMINDTVITMVSGLIAWLFVWHGKLWENLPKSRWSPPSNDGGAGARVPSSPRDPVLVGAHKQDLPRD